MVRRAEVFVKAQTWQEHGGYDGSRSLPFRSRVMSCRTFMRLLLILAVFLAMSAHAQTSASEQAAMQAKYRELRDSLASNAFGRPVHLDSRQTADEVEGDIYSVIGYPYRTVRSTLSQADNWCDILMLHLNVKYCSASQDENGNVLTLYAGTKKFQNLASAYRIDYRFQLGAVSDQYHQVRMSADAGPFGTTNYRILLEAIPLGPSRTFIHVRYSYNYGLMAKLAMQTYLNTLGSGKTGFTIESEDEAGNPVYVTGLRGAIERNTMRYYLAIDAYLKSLRLPEDRRLEARLRDWHRSTERYAGHLHEISLRDYLAMKRKEYERIESGE